MRASLLLVLVLAAPSLAGCLDPLPLFGAAAGETAPVLIDNGIVRCTQEPQPRRLLEWRQPDPPEGIPEARVEAPLEVPVGTVKLTLTPTEPKGAGEWRLSIVGPDGSEVWQNHRQVVGSVHIGGREVGQVHPGAYTLVWTARGALAGAALVVGAEVC